jgi:hypothetical protein
MRYAQSVNFLPSWRRRLPVSLAFVESAVRDHDAMPRIQAVTSAIACVLARASCTAGSHSSHLPVISTTNLPTATRPVKPSGLPTCGSTSGPQAWAEDVSAAGRVLWRTALTTQSQEVGSVVQPVAASGIAVFADDTSVYGLRLSDGRLLWRTVIGRSAVGMWTWSSTITVITGPSVTGATLVSLDLASGKERWEYPIPHDDLSNGQALTDDGGLATITSKGDLVVRSLDTGQVRWTASAACPAAYPRPRRRWLPGVRGRRRAGARVRRGDRVGRLDGGRHACDSVAEHAQRDPHRV